MTINEKFLLLILITLITSFLAIAYFLSVVKPFVEKRDFIKTEIQRTMGPEQYFWKRELKMLYVYHIPLIGKIIFNFLNN